MAGSKRVHKLLDKLAAAEQQFLAGEFLAPAVQSGEVRVRIAGVVCRLRIDPASFAGWGVFHPVSHRQARLVRSAALAERRQYLELFPAVRLILCRHEQDQWLAIAAHQGDRRFRIEGLVPVYLVEDPQLFEVVRSRFDGTHCWYDAADPRCDPAQTAYLRQMLHAMTPPESLDRPGLSAEQRAAYVINYVPRCEAQREAESDRTERRLREALAHAGGHMVEYLEHRDGYRVTYAVQGRRYVSSVDKRDLTVQAAGICLSGEDRKFDLQSLVGVLRQGRDEGELHRVYD